MNSLSKNQTLSCETLDTLSTQAALVQANKTHTNSHQIFVSLKPVGHHQLSVRQSMITFNCDRKPYTPSFIQPNQQTCNELLQKKFEQIYKQKISESMQQKCQLMLPKPSSDYCMICRQSFPDYLKHISHQVHRSRVSAQTGNAFINDIVQTIKKSLKGKANRCPASEFQMAPRKKRKIENVQGLATPQLIRKVGSTSSFALQQIKVIAPQWR